MVFCTVNCLGSHKILKKKVSRYTLFSSKVMNYLSLCIVYTGVLCPLHHYSAGAKLFWSLGNEHLQSSCIELHSHINLIVLIILIFLIGFVLLAYFFAYMLILY